ncbi:MAG: histidinol dehydrogenase [Clostridiaceae bacterium]|nr:histidinol dehydrogenase [Clostridiaceae bacterium]
MRIKIDKITQKDFEKLLVRLRQRSSEELEEVSESVRSIIREVRNNGDSAVFEFTKKFDGITLDRLEIDKNIISNAIKSLKPELVSTIRKAADNIRRFHEKQKINSWFFNEENGILMGQKVTALERVGVYVPGGTAPLPSSVLMNVIPAKVAGVKEIIMCTPPGKNGLPDPVILACADIAGTDRVFTVGGAQAVAAMAYGTETIPKVDKITGPGNIYVATAKKMVYGICGIDMIAGPSEILIIADETANAKFIAADLLSQAEHDMLASSILITTSFELAEKVEGEIAKQVERLPRKNFISHSLNSYGAIILADTLKDAVMMSNRIAPEHLELCVENPFELLGDVTNAGAVFLGNYSPEPLGDYIAGPNHVLPTNGTARFYSPLSVDDYLKKTSVISYSKQALAGIMKDVCLFAEAEGLTAHANSVRIRFEEENK